MTAQVREAPDHPGEGDHGENDSTGDQGRAGAGGVNKRDHGGGGGHDAEQDPPRPPAA